MQYQHLHNLQTQQAQMQPLSNHLAYPDYVEQLQMDHEQRHVISKEAKRKIMEAELLAEKQRRKAAKISRMV